MVIVKVGKPTERSKPGNRGKRDSQILLLHYLNRVHFDAPMSPLELEIYHQMRNVIGIDPAFYEYIFTIDADTVRLPSFYMSKSTDFYFLERDAGFTEPTGRCRCGRFKCHRNLWGDETPERGGLVVDDDPGVRILHLPPSFQGVRVALRLRHLFARLFLPLSYSHG